MKQRQLTMIAMGGRIGAGLFIGSGVVIASAGVAAVLSYVRTGAMIILVMRMLGVVRPAPVLAGMFPTGADW